MTRPADTEFAPFYAAYIARVPETDPLPALEAQPAELLNDRRSNRSGRRADSIRARQVEHPSGLRSHHRHRTGDGLSRVLHRARRNQTASRFQRKRLRRARRLERSAGQAARARVRCRTARESLDDSALVGRPVELHGQRQRVSGVGSCHRLHHGGARAAPRGDSEGTLRRERRRSSGT